MSGVANPREKERNHTTVLKCRLIIRTMVSLSLLSLLILLLSACGGNTQQSNTNATPTVCPPLTTVVGTIQSVNGSSYTIKPQKGQNVQITKSSDTLFSRQSQTTVSAIQVNTNVEIEPDQNNANNASIIVMNHLGTLPNGGTPIGSPIAIIGPKGGSPGPLGGTPPSLPSGTPPSLPSGTPPSFPGGGPSGGPSGSPSGGPSCSLTPPSPADGHTTVNGTVKQINDNQITVTTLSNGDQTLTVTQATQIVSIDSISADQFKTGMPVQIDGTKNNDGSLKAQLVTVLLKLPG